MQQEPLNTRVAIVGAGIAGLVAARELLRRGFAVELYERWPDVAGQASAFDLGNGVWIDRYYHHLFQSDSEMIALHDELLPGELEWHRSSVGMWARGRVWPFVSPMDLLRYGPLPLLDRVRLGLAVSSLMNREDWQAMDDIPALEWLRQRCGEASLRAVWMPLFLGKFGDDAGTIPLAWLWARFRVRRRLKGKGAVQELLGYPRSSFQRICHALADDIRARGGVIHLDRAVSDVRLEDGRYVLECAAPGAYRQPIETARTETGRSGTADAVLFTTPAPVTRRMVEWPEDVRRGLEDWTYRAAVVQLLELRRPFGDVYWMNVADDTVPFLGLVEHTNLVPAERYPARYLYVSNYVGWDDPLMGMSNDDLLAHYLSALRRLSPTFVEGDVLRWWTFREPHAQPMPRMGNRHRVLPFETSRDRLFLANTTQIYPEDRGTNYSARLGRHAADAIARRFGR